MPCLFVSCWALQHHHTTAAMHNVFTPGLRSFYSALFFFPDNPADYLCARQVMLFALAFCYPHAVDRWCNHGILKDIYNASPLPPNKKLPACCARF